MRAVAAALEGILLGYPAIAVSGVWGNPVKIFRNNRNGTYTESFSLPAPNANYWMTDVQFTQRGPPEGVDEPSGGARRLHQFRAQACGGLQAPLAPPALDLRPNVFERRERHHAVDRPPVQHRR